MSHRKVSVAVPSIHYRIRFTSALFYRFVTVFLCTVYTRTFSTSGFKRRIPIVAQQQSSRAVYAMSRLAVFVVSKSHLRFSVTREQVESAVQSSAVQSSAPPGRA